MRRQALSGRTPGREKPDRRLLPTGSEIDSAAAFCPFQQTLPNLDNPAPSGVTQPIPPIASSWRELLRMTMEAFVPPKPNEFERHGADRCRARLVCDDVQIQLLVRSRKLMFGGKNLMLQGQQTKTASIAPAAPNEWPIIPLVELTATRSQKVPRSPFPPRRR